MRGSVVEMVVIETLKMIKKLPRLTPTEISRRVGKSAQYIRNILAVLQELRLVETPVRGLYTITQLGEYILKNHSKQG